MINSTRNRFLITFLFAMIVTKIILNNCSNFHQMFDSIANIILTIIMSYFMSRFIIRIMPIKPVDPSNKAVLITGAASGIGRDLAIKLDQIGFTVFAGVRNVSNSDPRIDSLINCCSNKLHVIPLDVTIDDHVQEAVNYVDNVLKVNQLQLWSVVNNAGIMPLSQLIDGHSVDDVQKVMDTNLFGAVRVSKAFIPILSTVPNSRIVLVSSVSAHFAMPLMTNYAMSKFAMRAFGDGLRKEIKRFGIHVSMIEPASYETSLTNVDTVIKAFEDVCDKSPESIKKLTTYDDHQYAKNCIKIILSMTHPSTDPVIDVIVKSIRTSSEPEHYHQVVDTLDDIFYRLLLLPSEIVDELMNQKLFQISAMIWTLFNKFASLIKP